MSLELIIGGMYSGKSTELIRRVRCLSAIGKHVLVVNSVLDDRYNDMDVCTTHYGDKTQAIKLRKLTNLTSRMLIKGADGVTLPDVVAVDEAQFFPDLFEAVCTMVDSLQVSVMVAGLVGDFKRNHFGEIHRLLPLADDVHMCRAYCHGCCDGTKASFTKRLYGGDGQVEVGSTNKYIAVCRKCYLKA